MGNMLSRKWSVHVGAICFLYLDDHYNFQRHGNELFSAPHGTCSYACQPCIDIFMYYQYSLCWGTGPKVLKNQSSCCWIHNIVVLTTGVLLAASAFLICIITQATSLFQPCNPNPTMTSPGGLVGYLNYRNDMWMTNPGYYTLQVTSLVASKSMILDSLIAIRIRKCVQLFFEKHSRAASTLVPNIPRLGVLSIRCYDYPASMLQFTETHLVDGFPGKWFFYLFYFRCFPKLSLFGPSLSVIAMSETWATQVCCL